MMFAYYRRNNAIPMLLGLLLFGIITGSTVVLTCKVFSVTSTINISVSVFAADRSRVVSPAK